MLTDVRQQLSWQKWWVPRHGSGSDGFYQGLIWRGRRVGGRGSGREGEWEGGRVGGRGSGREGEWEGGGVRAREGGKEVRMKLS